MTEFKPISSIPGFEEYIEYEMDINGVIRRGDRILKWSLNDGYLKCTVYTDGKQKRLQQHRAIATLFIPNPDSKPFVDHRNGIRNDNRIDNLRWCTSAENRRNAKERCDNLVGLKNIYKHCKRRKYWCWRIRVSLNGKMFTKSFKCNQDDTEPPAEVLAHRDEMLKDLHGEFARSA